MKSFFTAAKQFFSTVSSALSASKEHAALEDLESDLCAPSYDRLLSSMLLLRPGGIPTIKIDISRCTATDFYPVKLLHLLGLIVLQTTKTEQSVPRQFFQYERLYEEETHLTIFINDLFGKEYGWSHKSTLYPAVAAELQYYFSRYISSYFQNHAKLGELCSSFYQLAVTQLYANSVINSVKQVTMPKEQLLVYRKYLCFCSMVLSPSMIPLASANKLTLLRLTHIAKSFDIVEPGAIATKTRSCDGYVLLSDSSSDPESTNETTTLPRSTS